MLVPPYKPDAPANGIGQKRKAVLGSQSVDLNQRDIGQKKKGRSCTGGLKSQRKRHLKIVGKGALAIPGQLFGSLRHRSD